MIGPTMRLTMVQALIRYLCNQFTEIDGQRVPLFAGVFGIFGHGNVTCLSEAPETVQDQLPTWRCQNEQSMALAAIGFAKAKQRRQIMVAATSIGPGAANMISAAVAVMLDPADCGLAFIGLAQDTQEIACDCPEVFFEPKVWKIPCPRPARVSVAQAAEVLKGAKLPQFISLNAARFGASKHRALWVVGDAKEGVLELDAAFGAWRADADLLPRGKKLFAEWNKLLDGLQAPTDAAVPPCQQVVNVVNRSARPGHTLITAASGPPGEVVKGWRVKDPHTFDCKFGFSCMGYEIPAGWGAAMAQEGPGFNNLLKDCRIRARNNPLHVDFIDHAKAMGAAAKHVESLKDLPSALEWAHAQDGVTVLSIVTDAWTWTPGDADWDVGVPEVSTFESVRTARLSQEKIRKQQRIGV